MTTIATVTLTQVGDTLPAATIAATLAATASVAATSPDFTHGQRCFRATTSAGAGEPVLAVIDPILVAHILRCTQRSPQPKMRIAGERCFHSSIASRMRRGALDSSLRLPPNGLSQRAGGERPRKIRRNDRVGRIHQGCLHLRQEGGFDQLEPEFLSKWPSPAAGLLLRHAVGSVHAYWEAGCRSAVSSVGDHQGKLPCSQHHTGSAEKPERDSPFCRFYHFVPPLRQFGLDSR